MRKRENLSPDIAQEIAEVMDKLDTGGTGLTESCFKFECKLVTPMFGGGVIAGEVDKAMPVRGTSIRGQLRFWWRLLAMHGPQKLSGKALFTAERAIWGGLGDSDTLAASKVQVRVRKVKNIIAKACMQYQPDKNGKPKPSWDENTPAYALFSAEKEVNGAKIPFELVKPGLQFVLELHFSTSLTAVELKSVQEDVKEAVRWWASFGGLGSRTRRGVGAVQVVSGLSPVSEMEVSGLGGKLVLGLQYAEATKAWEFAVNKLRDFRQKPGCGRNESHPRPGRSFWPEPDAIRRITGQYPEKHAPIHVAGNIFPRAAFGLPIIFQFPTCQSDPNNATLQPFKTDKKEKDGRMASPIILRPYWDGEKWRAAALLLPWYEQALTKKLEIKGRQEALKVWPENLEEQMKISKSINPMFDAATNKNRADDPLQAFLQFFREG